MRILSDLGTPDSLRRSLDGPAVATADELLISTDTHLRSPQKLQERTIAILVLAATSWPRIRRVTDRIQAAIAASESGG